MEAFRLTVPIGHLLVEQGVLTDDQCDRIMGEQESSGRPFGALAEELFGVSADAVERAWADQYALMAEKVDPSVARLDPAAIAMVDRRQAWQFRVLPMSFRAGQLTVCTTREHLVRALNFTTKHVAATCYFVLAKPEDLGAALMRHYPMEGMSREMVACSSEETVREAA